MEILRDKRSLSLVRLDRVGFSLLNGITISTKSVFGSCPYVGVESFLILVSNFSKVLGFSMRDTGNTNKRYIETIEQERRKGRCTLLYQ